MGKGLKGLTKEVLLKNVEPLILIVFLLVNLRVLNWFQPGYVVFSGDLRPPIVPDVFLNNALQSWNQVDWGIPSVYLPRLLDPFLFLMASFQSVGIDTQTSMFLSVYLIYVLVSILVYIYIKRLTNGDKLAAFVGAIFFTTNIYLIIDREQTAFGFMELSLIILPCLVTFTEGIRKKSFGFMAVSGFLFVLTYAAFPNYRAPVLCVIALVITLFALSINRTPIDSYTGVQRIDSTFARLRSTKLKFPRVSFDWSLIRKYAKYLGVFIAATLAASIWFFALIYTSINSLLSALSQATTPVASAFGNKAPDVFRLIAEWSIYWNYSYKRYVPYAPVYLNDPVMIVLSYVPTILAFAAIFISKTRKQALFFGGLAFLFLLLTSGSSEQFSQVYGNIMDAIPFLRAFRTSTNWIFLVILTFSMLLGLFASGLTRKLKNNALKILGIVLMVELFFFTAFPLMNGDVTRNWLDVENKGAYIPPYFKDAENAMPSNYWTILLPQRNVYIIYNYTDGGILSSGNPYPLVFSKPFISGSGTEYLQTPNQYLLYTTYYLISTGGYGFAAKHNTMASSFQNGTVLYPSLACDGNLGTRWASNGEPEPWLEIDYAEPQNISAVRIYFQDALGTEYTIQTWNGDNWVTQITETNNTSIRPEYQFQQTTITTKLRINFSGYLPWTVVSIFEVVINPQEYVVGEAVPKILGMLGVKNLLVENNIVDGNVSDVKDIGILNNNTKFTVTQRWNGASMYENAYALEKFYPASNITIIPNVDMRNDTLSADVFSQMYQAIITSPWSTLEHSAFISTTSNRSVPSIGKLQAPESFSWQEISATKYEVKTNSSGPFLLGFLENFDSQWKASVNGQSIPESDHVMVNDFGNGWIVNSTGNLTITVEYATQNLMAASVALSIILPAIFVMYIYRKNITKTVHKIQSKTKKRS